MNRYGGASLAVTCCACVCLSFFAIGAIVAGAIHGVFTSSGLDGERIYHTPANATGSGLAILHLDECNDLGGGELIAHEPRICGSIVEGQFFTTLAMYVVVWGGAVVAAMVFAVVAYFARKTDWARFWDVVVTVPAFFAFVPWALIGLVFLSRRFYGVEPTSSDNWVYFFAIASLVISFFAWWLAALGVSVGVGTSDLFVARMWRAIRRTSVANEIAEEDKKVLDEVADTTALIEGLDPLKEM